ncbi:MAG TPA: ATP synthase F1 subunit gamma [Phycisphaerales bacterium]|nr:ATP synthase F1 subunit gamma [Phycisphaerales bacterium]
MAKARKILKRTKAIKNIRTITRTMEMISSARFKQTHDLVVGIRPYARRLSEMVGDLVARCQPGQLDHPLLRTVPGARRDVLLVLTANRGLCAAYNSSVLKIALERREQILEGEDDVRLWVSGKRGISRLKHRGMEMDRTFTQFENAPSFRAVAAVADELMTEFLAGRISGLEVAYMQYVSAGRQAPAVAKVLPLSFMEAPAPTPGAPGALTPYEFLPEAGEVLGRLLPATVRIKLFQCFVDAAVSEQVMRVAAMRAATDSADEMVQTLTVRYNRMRQAQITTELAEIMGGRAAIK